MKPDHFESDYDLSVEFGLPVHVTGRWVALRCDRCGEVAIPGVMLEELSAETVLVLLRFERCLSGREARFLRKAALCEGQEALARRLGVSRITVARWEAESSLSPEHDLALRGVVLAHLAKQANVGLAPWKKHRRQVVPLLTTVLDSARSMPAPLTPEPIRLEQRAA